MESNPWRRPGLRLGVLVTVLSLLAAPLGAGNSKTWNDQLQKVLALLRGQQWQQALDGSQELLDSFARDLAPGKKADRSVALVVMCRALAEAGQGREADAAWDWHVAQQIDPAMESWNLAEFGAAGALLDQHRLARDPRPLAVDPSAESTVTPVVRVGEPRFPKWPAAAYRIGWGGTVVVEAVIGADGALSHPRLLDAPPVATMALAVFDALRGSRFEPARRGGEPVASLYRLGMKYTYTR